MGIFDLFRKKGNMEKQYTKLMSDALKDKSPAAGKAMAVWKKEKNKKK